ncbi:PAS domain S-box protein [Methanoculleus taiwanensis]|uniref:PAS domain S-box protein n=1 Tax=Methanoculleus taiwanensis TaxID=1550565 RepID=UPI0013E8CA23|nr:PAS domain S-box protein [Methanoculleus taiwanensis]
MLWINPAMERLAGISAGDARGSDLLQFVAARVLPQADEACTDAVISSIRNRTDEHEITCRVAGPAGEAWYAYTSRQLGKGALAGIRIHRFREITREEKAAREHERCFGDLAFLSRAATGLAGLPPDADIFAAIGSYLHELAPDSIVIVSAADARAGTLTPRAIFGMEYCLPEVATLLGRDITGITLNLPRTIRDIMVRGEIEEIEGGLEAVALWQIPLDACRKLEEAGGLGAMYCIPFTWKGEVFGTAVILTRREGAPVHLGSLDTFKNLAAIAVQRHQAENELRRSEETFRALIEKTSDFILILDEQMKIRFASPPIERIDGISPEMLVGRSAFEMMLPEEVPRAEEIIADLVQRPGGSVPFEVRFRGMRGMHVIEAVITNLLDDPRIRGIVVNARDITRRKRAEEALQRAERDKALILNSTAEMFAYYDTDLRVLWVNQAAAAFIGRRPEDLVGHFCYEIWHGRTGVCQGCPVILARETGKPHETEITTPDGRVFFLRGYPVLDEEGTVIGLIEFGQDITDRKRAEQELRIKDLAIASSLNAITLTDPAQKVLYVNQAVLDLWGYAAPEDVLGRPVSIFWADPGDPEMVTDALRREGRWSGELPARRRDGTVFPVQVSVVQVTAEDGTPRISVGSAIDITEQKQAKEALEAANAYNRSLIEANLDPLVTIGSDGRITDVNTATEQVTGYTRDELIGTDFSDYFTDPAGARAGYRKVFAEGQVRDYPLEIRHRDGSTTPVLYNATVYRDEEGTVTGVFAAARDITERIRAEKAIQRRSTEISMLNRLIRVSASALTLDELLESALTTSLALFSFDVGAIYLLDRERNSAKLMRYRGAERAPGLKTVNVLHHPFDDIFVAGRFRSISAGPAIGEAEEEVLAAFGVSSLTWIPLVAESRVVGAMALGSVAGRQAFPDVRWLMEAISREIGAGILRAILYKQREAANQEANLYLDILTHDIRNVNTVATMYTDLLVDILEGDPKTYVLKMKGSIEKSTEILANVATIRKIHVERAPLKPIDLHGVVLAEQKNFPDTAITYENTAYTVQADDLLPEVFNNLIGNAVKFGGPDVAVTISAERSGDSVIVTVADTGPGIPDDLKEGIFHRFERGQTRARGEGLGLYICRKLMERYGGSIWAEDRVPGRSEKGAAFRFTLKEVRE